MRCLVSKSQDPGLNSGEFRYVVALLNDRVLDLIKQWLNAPVIEPPDEKNGGRPRMQRRKQGTPQGGVLSPLLANIHLHWFDSLPPPLPLAPAGCAFVASDSLRSADRAFNGKEVSTPRTQQESPAEKSPTAKAGCGNRSAAEIDSQRLPAG
jgi:hypothetical protein